MLFSEIYGSYFNTVAEVLKRAVECNITDCDINNIINEKAFGESIINIPALIKGDEWQLLNSDMETPLVNVPDMPLTILQKQWLKALLYDPRIKLFNPCIDGLEDVEPLYEQGTIEYFDRYSDGDSFDNPKYIENFHIILKAVKKHKKLKIKYTGRQWKDKEFICSPIKLQYSSKDDKFRLKAIAYKKMFTLNLSRIEACEMTGFDIYDDLKKYEHIKDTVIFELLDDRNALERVMLSFSHLEKETKRQEDNRYQVTLKYDRDDETEILIRILSFGPLIRVISPDSFIEKLKKRIDNQMNCGV